MILEVDEEKRRISLGLKQLTENPWQVFEHTHNEGDKVSGAIKSITDFGVFIELEGGIDGLVHLSDISWDESEESVRALNKGDVVEALVLSIESERERISLGIKQLVSDSFGDYIDANKKGSRVNATIIGFSDDRIDESYSVEGELRSQTSQNIKRLIDIGTYRGLRHRKGLPVRGQNTKNNSRTRKGKKRTVAGKKKATV